MQTHIGHRHGGVTLHLIHVGIAHLSAIHHDHRTATHNFDNIFAIDNGRRVFIYAKTNNKRIVGHGHHQATSAAAPLKVLIDDDAIGQP